jgi:serine/threonine protein phosphatase PrpC
VVKLFAKLFGQKKDKTVPNPAAQMADGITTMPLSDKQVSSIIHNLNQHFDTQQLIVGIGQSVGKQREHNEDSLLAITSTISGNSGNVPFGIYIVADGMGGHQYGEVASNSAIRVIAGDIMRTFHSYLFNLPTQPLQESLQEIMEAAIKNAHRTVQKDAPGSGTTVTAALVLGQQVTIAHIGDSRAYAVYPDRRIETITRDHSLVKRQEEHGHLSKDEAANFPHRNVLIRALGQGELLEADIFTIPFPKPGYLMLCSDGLWGVINDQDISRTIVEAPTLHRACQNLVEAANLAGGPDNITTIVVQLIG